MILKGSQRGGAKQLATHLLNDEDNDHVEVLDVRGFVSEDLTDALMESYAVSRGTKCVQHLFSLSLSPPQEENVAVSDFEEAVSKVETKLGLTDQPRAIVFHEKEGRRHAHVVWSRIDAEEMKAVHLPHFKTKLRDISRELFIQHEWQMPKGLMNREQRDPSNFTLAEWQQSKRTKLHPEKIDTIFRDCWAISDSRAGFESALREHGFLLARGDRRGFVAVGHSGEVYAIARKTGQKTKTVNERLGDPKELPSVDERKTEFREKITRMLKVHVNQVQNELHQKAARIEERRQRLVHQQRTERETLRAFHAQRMTSERSARAARLRGGLAGIWDWVTGKKSRINRQNQLEEQEAVRRDRAEMQKLVDNHLKDRQRFQLFICRARQSSETLLTELNADILRYDGAAAESTKKMVHDQDTGHSKGRWRDDPDHEPA